MRRSAVYLLERIAARFSDAELLQNEEDLPVLLRLGVDPGKLQVIGNGIDLSRFDPATVPPDARSRARAAWGVGSATIIIGAVGRLVAEKGWHELFAALAGLRAEGHDAVLVAVGPADPAKPDALSRDELAAAEAAGVILTGWQEHIEDCYPGFDLFCLPSWREGFPRAAMEAAAMGLAIVASDVRGCRQVVEDGVTGILTPPRDLRALQDALRSLVTDADLRRRFGLAGRHRALDAFDVRQQSEATLATYRRQASKVRRGANRTVDRQR